MREFTFPFLEHVAFKDNLSTKVQDAFSGFDQAQDNESKKKVLTQLLSLIETYVINFANRLITYAAQSNEKDLLNGKTDFKGIPPYAQLLKLCNQISGYFMMFKMGKYFDPKSTKPTIPNFIKLDQLVILIQNNMKKTKDLQNDPTLTKQCELLIKATNMIKDNVAYLLSLFKENYNQQVYYSQNPEDWVRTTAWVNEVKTNRILTCTQHKAEKSPESKPEATSPNGNHF